jgi:hypothetical protein
MEFCLLCQSTRLHHPFTSLYGAGSLSCRKSLLRGFSHSPDHTKWQQPEIMESLKAKAKAAGLWNLFSPHAEHGLNNADYAPLAEITGRSFIAPRSL